MEPHSTTKIIPMDKLPTEALTKIFKLSSPKELLNLALTCKTFNNLINTTPEIAGDFMLDLNEESVNNEWIGSRIYTKIFLNGKFADKYWPIIEQIDPKFVWHFVCCSKGIKIHVLKNILLRFENLMTVSVGVNDQMSSRFMNFEEPLPRLNLILLEYQGSARNFPIFKKCQAEFLEIDKVYDKRRDDEVFNEFLLEQKSLGELTLNNFLEHSTLFQKSYENVEFRLKKLKLKFLDAWDQENFHNFLKPHKDSLEKLELIGNGEMLPHFEKFTKLKEVKLTHANLPDVDAKLKSVVHVVVKDVKDGFHKIFPNMESLGFKKYFQSLNFTEECKKLSVLIFDKIEIPQLEIPQIKKLVLDKVTLKDGKPFNYKTAKKLSQIVVVKTSTKWLPNFLEQREKKFLSKTLSLKLEKVKVDWKLKWALKGFSDKIQDLKLINVEEVEADEDEREWSDSESSELSTHESDEENESIDEESVDKKYFDELPEEILIEIFKFLSLKDRLNLSEVCGTFLEVSSSSIFMKDMKLHLKSKTVAGPPRKTLQIIDGLRQYEEVAVEGQAVDFYAPLFDQFGSSVKTLELYVGGLTTRHFEPSSAVEIIKKCKNLKNLTIRGGISISKKFEVLDELSLDTFAFNGSLEFFGCFKKFKTKSLEFEIENETEKLVKSNFADFLINQSDLKSLAIFGSDKTPLYSHDVRLLDVKFKLEKLKLHGTKFAPNMKDFVSLFEDSLQEIQLDQSTKYFLKVVEKFPNLKKVRLDQVRQHNDIRRLFGVLMPQVEELEGNFCYGSYLDSFPNIKKIKLTCDFRLLYTMFANCKKVEEIDIYGSEDFRPFRLPESAKKFKLSSCSPWSSWRNIAVPFNITNNKIEELEISNSANIRWIANLLHHAPDRKLKILIENSEIPLRLQRAFEVYRDRIEKLKLVECTNEINQNNLEIDLNEDDDEHNEEGNILDLLQDRRINFEIFGDEDEEEERARVIMQYNPLNLD